MSQITKKALAGSLKTLLEKTTLDKITVKDIVNQCEVNRQTFYYHFQDVYALLDWIFVTEAENMIADNKMEESWQQVFLSVFQYLNANKSFIMNSYRSIGREYLEQYLYKSVYEVIISIVEKESERIKVSEKDQAFIANFYKFAIVGLVLEWIRTGMKENPEEIIDELSKMIDRHIQKALEGC